MALLKFKALGVRYMNHKRFKEGEYFFIDEKDLQKDANGKIILPKYSELIGEAKSKAKSKQVEPVPELDNDEVI